MEIRLSVRSYCLIVLNSVVLMTPVAHRIIGACETIGSLITIQRQCDNVGPQKALS
jgi:hypothetical protein